MRFTAISIATALVIGASATSVFAQQTPTFDNCFSLSEKEERVSKPVGETITTSCERA